MLGRMNAISATFDFEVNFNKKELLKIWHSVIERRR